MIYWQNHFLERGHSGEGGSHSVAEKISSLLWKLELPCSIHKSLPWDTIPTKLYPFSTLSACLFKISFGMTLSSVLMSPKLILTWRFSCQVLHASYCFEELVKVSDLYNILKHASFVFPYQLLVTVYWEYLFQIIIILKHCPQSTVGGCIILWWQGTYVIQYHTAVN